MFAAPADPVTAALDASGGASPLPAWGLIRAEGPDAATFLHGQLSQDIQGLPLGQACLAGYCSAKGRLLATLVVWRVAPESYLLACSADLLAATLKRLSMFVLRARCKLSAASSAPASNAGQPTPTPMPTPMPTSRPADHIGLWGLWGDRARTMADGLAPWSSRDAADGARVLALPAVMGLPRAWWIPGSDSIPPEVSAGARTGDPTWDWLEVQSGIPRVVAATTDQFVPQMVNLELVGGVNFKKGCYPGQEVVARSQYRGTLKRRLQLVTVEGDGLPAALPVPGTEVLHSLDPGQPAGMVVLSAGHPVTGSVSAQVELKLSALDGGSLHLGSATGPAMRLGALPYLLPATEAA